MENPRLNQGKIQGFYLGKSKVLPRENPRFYQGEVKALPRENPRFF